MISPNQIDNILDGGEILLSISNCEDIKIADSEGERVKILKSRCTISKTYDSKIVCPPTPGAAQANPKGFKLLLGSESLLLW